MVRLGRSSAWARAQAQAQAAQQLEPANTLLPSISRLHTLDCQDGINIPDRSQGRERVRARCMGWLLCWLELTTLTPLHHQRHPSRAVS